MSPLLSVFWQVQTGRRTWRGTSGEAAAPLDLRERLEGLQVLLRICEEVRAFNGFNSYAYTANLGLLAVVRAFLV